MSSDLLDCGGIWLDLINGFIKSPTAPWVPWRVACEKQYGAAVLREVLICEGSWSGLSQFELNSNLNRGMHRDRHVLILSSGLEVRFNTPVEHEVGVLGDEKVQRAVKSHQHLI